MAGQSGPEGPWPTGARPEGEFPFFLGGARKIIRTPPCARHSHSATRHSRGLSSANSRAVSGNTRVAEPLQGGFPERPGLSFLYTRGVVWPWSGKRAAAADDHRRRKKKRRGYVVVREGGGRSNAIESACACDLRSPRPRRLAVLHLAALRSDFDEGRLAVLASRSTSIRLRPRGLAVLHGVLVLRSIGVCTH